MNTPRILIKLGGAALQEVLTLDTVARAITELRRTGKHVILVHGGGPAINEELRRRGIDWTFVGGQRVTTALMMDAIESVLCGQVNRRVVRHLGALGVNAIGFSGADHQTLLCTQSSPDLGLVGKIEKVSAGWIEGILQLPSQPVPVIAPIGVGANGERYNVNADWAATHLAVALKVDELLFLTDQKGVLDEEGQLIRAVDTGGLRNMIDAKMVTGGMLTKTLAVLHALNHGVPCVRVMRGLDAAEELGQGDFGTTCLNLTSQPVEGGMHAAL